MLKEPMPGVHCFYCEIEYLRDGYDKACSNSPDGEHEWEDALPWEVGPDSGPEESEGDEGEGGGTQDPPDLDLVAVLGEELVRNRESWDKNGRIYASELGLALGPDFDGCQLAFWHACRNAPRRTETPGQILMTVAGELLHDYVASLMKTACLRNGWEVVSIEKRVTLEHDGVSIGSRLDVKIRHMETGWTRVVDIKTKRGKAFSFLNEPKEGNVLQVQGYVKAEDADDGSVLYVDREGQNFMREFLIERADERPEKAIEILRDIRDSETPPPPVGLRLKRVTNKGPDSVYLNTPWQIEWCNLKECACKQALGGTPPDGILAKLKEDKKSGATRIQPTTAGARWGDLICRMLEEEYPDETFVLEPATEE